MDIGDDEYDLNDNPSMEQQGDVLEEWFDVTDKWIENPGEACLLLLESNFLLVELKECLEDEELGDISYEEQENVEPLLAVRDNFEHDLGGGVVLLLVERLFKFIGPFLLDTVKSCPVTFSTTLN